MALTLLRHASVPKRYQGCYIGWSDIEIDRATIQSNPLKNKLFDAIYSSDLVRCIDTLKQLRFSDFIIDKRLREVRFKSWAEGKSFDEISKRADFSESHLESFDSWHRYIADESKVEFRARIESFLSELDNTKEILICTHAGVIREILSIYGRDTNIKIDYLSVIEIN